MKLQFKLNQSDDFEKTLASARYHKFWDDNQKEILESFYKHTGLNFRQKNITVRIRSDGRSKAGNRFQPMELSMSWKDPERVACTLIHELAHRLVIGNGIDPPEGNAFIESRANYYMHRHIYLFLYDVYIDLLGRNIAKEEVKRESDDPNLFYAKAWKWALAKNYRERQATFRKLKQHYLT